MRDDWNSPERIARSEGYAAGYAGVPRSKAPKDNRDEWIKGYEAAVAIVVEKSPSLFGDEP